MNWIVPSNSTKYDVDTAFSNLKSVDWGQGNKKYQVGDIVYIYCSKPEQKIKFKCLVTHTNLPFSETIDDSKYYINPTAFPDNSARTFIRLFLLDYSENASLGLSFLMNNGLKSAPQGPMHIKEELASYIIEQFDNTVFPEEIVSSSECHEGDITTVTVNRYERSAEARAQCIAASGYICQICGLNFEEVYGVVGKCFIHVHHIIPLHEIQAGYVVNPREDLIPVCPNCHAMLHRKIDGKYLTVAELKAIVQK